MKYSSPILLALALGATVSCAATQRTFGLGGGCAVNNGSQDWVIRTAVGAVVTRGDADDARIRSLADVSPNPDSIRARLRLVHDDRVCRAAGGTAHRWRANDQYVVLQLGRMYWVRGSSWHYTNAVDDHFQRIVSYVDMD